MRYEKITADKQIIKKFDIFFINDRDMQEAFFVEDDKWGWPFSLSSNLMSRVSPLR